jgi:hypothetical protein
MFTLIKTFIQEIVSFKNKYETLINKTQSNVFRFKSFIPLRDKHSNGPYFFNLPRDQARTSNHRMSAIMRYKHIQTRQHSCGPRLILYTTSPVLPKLTFFLFVTFARDTVCFNVAYVLSCHLRWHAVRLPSARKNHHSCHEPNSGFFLKKREGNGRDGDGDGDGRILYQ